MMIAWALIYFGNRIEHIFAGLAISGMSGGLLEAPVSYHTKNAIKLETSLFYTSNRSLFYTFPKRSNQNTVEC